MVLNFLRFRLIGFGLVGFLFNFFKKKERKKKTNNLPEIISVKAHSHLYIGLLFWVHSNYSK